MGETNVGHAGQKMGPANHIISHTVSHATSAKVKGSRKFTGESPTGQHGTGPLTIRKPWKKGDISYAVAKHQLNDHKGQDHNFTFKVHQSYKSSLERQIRETILIDSEDPEAKLNSKDEWGLNSIPRFIVHQDIPESQPNQPESDCQSLSSSNQASTN